MTALAALCRPTMRRPPRVAFAPALPRALHAPLCPRACASTPPSPQPARSVPAARQVAVPQKGLESLEVAVEDAERAHGPGPPKTAAALRALYHITELGDPPRAAEAARASLRALPLWSERRPVSAHTVAAFEAAVAWRRRKGARGGLVIDAGCGCGGSTLRIARALPGCDVIGVDRSEVRLGRNRVWREGGDDGNALLVRADLVDFWRLCAEAGWRVDYHFILYPNPYPRAKHLKRRWHGHAAFPYIVALGGRIEVRASWSGYLDEFRAAFQAVSADESAHIGAVRELDAAVDTGVTAALEYPLTNFEAKYVACGQPVYSLCIETRDDAHRAKCTLKGEDPK